MGSEEEREANVWRAAWHEVKLQGCEGYGELWVCLPAPARLRYAARPSGCPASAEAAQGSWALTLTSLAPYLTADGRERYQAHGNLNATLVNREDPSDSVVLELDF